MCIKWCRVISTFLAEISLFGDSGTGQDIFNLKQFYPAYIKVIVIPNCIPLTSIILQVQEPKDDHHATQ